MPTEIEDVKALSGQHIYGTEILGHPTDCTQAPDGSIVFSDDSGSKVYRLKYVGK